MLQAQVINVPTNIDTTVENYAIYLSDAEVQELKIGNKTYFAGKYQNTRKLANKWDYRHFVVPADQLTKGEIKYTIKNITLRQSDTDAQFFPAYELNSELSQIIRDGKFGILFTLFFLGAISIFLIYTLGLYIQTRNDDFKYYAFYLGAILLHNTIQADAFLKVFAVFPRNPIWYHNINEFLQMFIYAFFMLFIMKFLELARFHPKINVLVRRSIWATIVFAFVFLITAVVFKDFNFLQNYLSVLWLVVATLGAIIVIRVYRDSNNPIRYFIVIGSILLLIGSILELWSSLQNEDAYNWNLYATPDNGWFPFNYTQLAILGETICFALGIGYKISQNEKLLINLQEKQIEDLKVRENQASLESKVLDAELSALRSQMNPHFLFNSLNSVNEYIMREKPQVASEYLTKFAQLMRIILNHSKEEKVKLSNELKAISLYVELEELRFKDQFEFVINVDEVNLHDVLIPPMLIQPFVENSIKHGFINLQKKGKLSLNLSRKEDQIVIEIVDNGAGRQHSKVNKSAFQTQQKSYGLKITEDRISILNKIYDLEAKLDINDGKEGGTVVTLSFTEKSLVDEN